MKTESNDLNISRSTIKLINARSKDDVEPAHSPGNERMWLKIDRVYEFLSPKCAVKNGIMESRSVATIVPQSSGSVARTLGDQYKVYWRHI